MEGLIPFMYRKIKSRTQRPKHTGLSDAAALDYHLENLYLLGHHQVPSLYGNGSMGKVSSFELDESHHRRNKSMGAFPGPCASPLGVRAMVVSDASPLRHRRAVSFRSTKMFSCVSGD